MDQIAAEAIAILQARADGSVVVGIETPLSDLHIEALDFALILIDLEDAFDIDFPRAPDVGASDFATVGAVVERVRALVEAKQISPLTPAMVARRASLWLTRSRA